MCVCVQKDRGVCRKWNTMPTTAHLLLPSCRMKLWEGARGRRVVREVAPVHVLVDI